MPGPFDSRPLTGPTDFYGYGAPVVGPSDYLDAERRLRELQAQAGGMGAGPMIADAGDTAFDQYGLGGAPSIAVDVPSSFLQARPPQTEFERRFGGAASPMEALQAGLPPSVALTQAAPSREQQAGRWQARETARQIAERGGEIVAQPSQAAPGEVTLPSAMPAAGAATGADPLMDQLLSNAFRGAQGGAGPTRAQREQYAALSAQDRRLFDERLALMNAQAGRQAGRLGQADVARMMGEQAATDLDAQREGQRVQQQEELGNVRAQIQKQQDQVASGEIDPDRLLGDGLTGNRILAAIASALGSYAATLSGGRNFALETINERIERDIAAQREQLNTDRTALQNRETYYARAMDQFGNDEQAHAAARAAMLAHYEGEANRLVEGTTSEDVLANNEQLQNGLRAERTAAELAAANAGMRRRGGARGGSVSEQVSALNLRDRLSRQTEGPANAQLQAAEDENENLDRLAAIRARVGATGERFDDRTIDEARQIRREIAITRMRARGQRINEQSVTAEAEGIADPTALSPGFLPGFDDPVQENIDAQRAVARRRLETLRSRAAPRGDGGRSAEPERYEEDE
jgi:hypothetical protein